MKIIDGKHLAQIIQNEIADNIAKENTNPALAAILVGNNPASNLYVRLKEKACKEVGITFHRYLLDTDITKKDLIETIHFLNTDDETDGILLQLPLPNPKWEDEIIKEINPQKDVDGFHPNTIKNLLAGEESIVPGLASGIIHLIKTTSINLENKKIVIICNNTIFATPIKYLLEKEKSNVQITHADDKDLTEKTKKADVIIIAIGQPNFLSTEMVKNDIIIIDVGINKESDGSISGDVNHEAFTHHEGYITPVPGGVGPMTVAMLLYNVWKIHTQKNK